MANTISEVVSFPVAEKVIVKKQEIQKLIDSFVGNESVFAPNTISPDVADSAKKFIDLIPLGKNLPKIAADGEGAMEFLWTYEKKHLLVVLEADQLHLAIDAATENVDYVPDVPFDGINLPDQLRTLIPG